MHKVPFAVVISPVAMFHGDSDVLQHHEWVLLFRPIPTTEISIQILQVLTKSNENVQFYILLWTNAHTLSHKTNVSQECKYLTQTVQTHVKFMSCVFLLVSLNNFFVFYDLFIYLLFLCLVMLLVFLFYRFFVFHLCHQPFFFISTFPISLPCSPAPYFSH